MSLARPCGALMGYLLLCYLCAMSRVCHPCQCAAGPHWVRHPFHFTHFSSCSSRLCTCGGPLGVEIMAESDHHDTASIKHRPV